MTWLTNPYRFGGIPPSTPASSSVNWSVRSLTGAQGTLSIGDIAMAATPGGANLCTGGTGRERWTSFNPSGSFVVNGSLFDGNAVTNRNASPTHDLMEGAYEFAAAQLPTEIKITAPSSSPANTGLGYLISVSYDGRTTWVPCAVFTTPNTWTASEVRAFTIDPRVNLSGTGRSAARAWRVVSNAWAGGSQPRIGTLIFASSAGGPTLCTGGSPVVSNAGFGSDPINAFDANAATWWNGVGVGVPGQTLGYVFPALVNAVQVRIQASSDSPIQTPTGFDVQWSIDLTNWTTALTVSGSTGWTASETRSWTIP